MEKENEKNEYITRVDLEEQTQTLLTALDGRFGKMESRLMADTGSSLGKMELRLEKKMDAVRDELKHTINNVQTLIDGYVKAQEDFRQEFVIMKDELKQIKKIIKEKLGLEIKTA